MLRLPDWRHSQVRLRLERVRLRLPHRDGTVPQRRPGAGEIRRTLHQGEGQPLLQVQPRNRCHG